MCGCNTRQKKERRGAETPHLDLVGAKAQAAGAPGYVRLQERLQERLELSGEVGRVAYAADDDFLVDFERVLRVKGRVALGGRGRKERNRRRREES